MEMGGPRNSGLYPLVTKTLGDTKTNIDIFIL
jgi:hypothetical protein